MGGANKYTYLKRIRILHEQTTLLNMYYVAPDSVNNYNMIAKANSSCSAHFSKEKHKDILHHLQLFLQGPIVRLSDKTCIKDLHSGLIPFQRVTKNPNNH